MAAFDLITWVGFALAASGWLVVALGWKLLRRRERLLERRLEAVEQQLNAVNGASVGMGKRLLKLQRRVRKAANVSTGQTATGEPAVGGQAAALLQRDFSGARRPSAEDKLLTLVRERRAGSR